MSSFLLTICVCMFISSISAQEPERKLYIAYMGYLPEGEYSPSLHHSQIIEQVVHPSFASKSLIRSYGRSFNGFAAYLSLEEKHKLSRIPGVVSVFPSQKSRPQTTRSWDFMGLDRSTERRHVAESDTIVGVIDFGIWPESESFTDEGYGPIPAKWKGTCDGGENFVCNRKIIGARTYSIESKDTSARDTSGHGTHVASIIAGNQVRHASYYGLASGIARGGVPSARLAIYKVCNLTCADIDVLSAFDQAIADGVDLISISLNSRNPKELSYDPVAIGAFHAIEKGILTVQSAGNSGPYLSSMKSYAPWILSVGASDTDRKIVDKLLIGKHTILMGNGINAFPSSASTLPLVYGKEVTSSCLEIDARNCLSQCLESSLVDKKVVLCDRTPIFIFEEVNTSCAATGYIYPDSENYSQVMLCPAIGLTENDLELVKIFKNSTIEPQVQIFKSESIHSPNAPFVAPFSSRGPSIYMPEIIKPDVVAPGVEILAAFPPIGSPYGSDTNKKYVPFNIISGTSMACPHVAAAAAFVKSFHPEWSPSAIKSALMTTAWEMNASLNPEGEFAYGSGHINPIKATDPGLVYEASFEELMKIWCNVSQTLGSVRPVNASCSEKFSIKDINYPSMIVQVEAGVPFTVSIPRTVTNVGQPNSRYVASIKGDSYNLNFSLKPDTLQFAAMRKTMNFVLIVRGNDMKPQTTIRMSLVWNDGIHIVRSPIMIFTTPDIGEIPPMSSSPSDGKIAPTPSSPLVNSTMSNAERTSTRSRLHHIVFMLILLLMITMY